MTIAQIIEKMIAQANGCQHDISHFLKVWAFAKTIGELEELDEHTQRILETAAVIHDIACPLCREKYGSAPGKLQERESEPLVRAFLEDTGFDEADTDRIVFLVCHHHTPEEIDGQDYQILIEADYIVNAMENHLSPENMRSFRERFLRTQAGTEIAADIFGN